MYRFAACSFFKGWERRGGGSICPLGWVHPSLEPMQRESEWKKGGWGGIDSQMWRRIYVTDLHGPMGKLVKYSEMRVHDHNVKAKAEQKLTCKQAQTCRQTHTKAGLMFHDWNETKNKSGVCRSRFPRNKRVCATLAASQYSFSVQNWGI